MPNLTVPPESLTELKDRPGPLQEPGLEENSPPSQLSLHRLLGERQPRNQTEDTKDNQQENEQQLMADNDKTEGRGLTVEHTTQDSEIKDSAEDDMKKHKTGMEKETDNRRPHWGPTGSASDLTVRSTAWHEEQVQHRAHVFLLRKPLQWISSQGNINEQEHSHIQKQERAHIQCQAGVWTSTTILNSGAAAKLRHKVEPPWLLSDFSFLEQPDEGQKSGEMVHLP
ncbi:uncharacterized protein [Lepisosteus oculatus]|uniref:uncharacterized protein n=1 Tax=Lepisosteus oculatus TaxID=7918 RepID=UPI0035F50735